MLEEVPGAPAVSVAAPPWNRLLGLLSAAVAAPEKIKGPLFMIVPLWPAQPWWPLVLQLSNNCLWSFNGNPWVSPAGKRAKFQAVGFWLGC